MVGHVRLVPRGLGRSHLYDAAPEGPDVAGPPVVLPSEDLRSHEGDRALKLALELGGDGGEGGHAGGGPKVPDLQVVAARVHQEVCTLAL